MNVDSCGKAAPRGKNRVKWANLDIFCWEIGKNVNLPPIMWWWFQKNMKTNASFYRAKFWHHIASCFKRKLKLWQPVLKHPLFPCELCAAYNLIMMLIWRILSSQNIQDEASTVIIKMFWSHLQAGIVQTVQKVIHCLRANISEKPLNSIASWCSVTSYTEFLH
mgnify:CR=1 FL=1